eukprot:1393375-Amorphochlora_amoeboformis.AAC.1
MGCDVKCKMLGKPADLGHSGTGEVIHSRNTHHRIPPHTPTYHHIPPHTTHTDKHRQSQNGFCITMTERSGKLLMCFRFRTITTSYYRSCDAILLVFDISDNSTFTYVTQTPNITITSNHLHYILWSFTSLTSLLNHETEPKQTKPHKTEPHKPNLTNRTFQNLALQNLTSQTLISQTLTSQTLTSQTSPHKPHLTNLTSQTLTSNPHLTNPHLTNPRLLESHLTNPHLTKSPSLMRIGFPQQHRGVVRRRQVVCQEGRQYNAYWSTRSQNTNIIL